MSKFESSPTAATQGSMLHIVYIKCRFLDLHKNIVHMNAENTQEIFELQL